MNIETMSPETAAAIPSEDIALWRTKIQRAQFALRQQTRVDEEDQQAAWILADPNPFEPVQGYWDDVQQREEAYEAAIMYKLDTRLSIDGLRGALELSRIDRIDISRKTEITQAVEPDASTRDRAHKIGRQALLDGFARLGMVKANEDGEITAPAAVVAAMMYERADIKQATDRRLYERCEEIDAVTSATTRAVVPRTAELTFHDGETAAMPIYRALSFSNFDGEHIGEDGFNLIAPTFYGKWWQELGHDFARLEAAAQTVHPGQLAE